MENSNFDLIVVGHLLKEKIIFPDGKEIELVLGSPCAYISVAAARLGLKTGIVTKIGRDMPQELLKVFSDAGVDIQGLRTGKDTTTNLLTYDKSGRKKLEFLNKAPDILFEDIPSSYLDSNLFLLCPIDYEVPLSLIKSLHQSGKTLSMELSGYGGASSSKEGRISKDQRLDFLKELTPYFEIIKGGQEDCQCLFGEDPPDAEKIAARFIEWGAKISIITLGEKGAVAVTQDNPTPAKSASGGFTPGALPLKVHRIPAFPAKVADCTGAGDVFHAGFLAAYLSSRDLEKSVRFALATASLVIESTGGVTASRMPTTEQVWERMRDGKISSLDISI